LRKLSYGRIVIGCGVVGTVVAVIGIADSLIDFLVLLGLIVPPVAAVYLTDFFLFGRRDYAGVHEVAPSDTTNVSGVLGCTAGTIIGITTYFSHHSLTGIPTIEAFVSASLVYGLLEKLRALGKRDRGWQPLA
jgi:cytosine permease